MPKIHNDSDTMLGIALDCVATDLAQNPLADKASLVLIRLAAQRLREHGQEMLEISVDNSQDKVDNAESAVFVSYPVSRIEMLVELLRRERDAVLYGPATGQMESVLSDAVRILEEPIEGGVR